MPHHHHPPRHLFKRRSNAFEQVGLIGIQLALPLGNMDALARRTVLRPSPSVWTVSNPARCSAASSGASAGMVAALTAAGIGNATRSRPMRASCALIGAVSVLRRACNHTNASNTMHSEASAAIHSGVAAALRSNGACAPCQCGDNSAGAGTR